MRDTIGRNYSIAAADGFGRERRAQQRLGAGQARNDRANGDDWSRLPFLPVQRGFFVGPEIQID